MEEHPERIQVGKYWHQIEGYEQGGTCPICDKQEDMDHILTTCKSKARELMWDLANGLWRRHSDTLLPHRLGDIQGCGLAEFKTNNKIDKGKN